MKYSSALIPGRLIKRYKRFLADIELANGDIITAHCANTGAMTGCADPGCRVWLWDSANPRRKLRYSWEWTEVAGLYKACINTARANQLVAEFLQAQLTAEPGTAPASSPDSLTSLTISERFQGYTRVQREPKVTDGRLDFLLQGEGLPDLYIEVKSLTLLREDRGHGMGCFPDARTERGLKHLRRLQQLQQQGHRSLLLFCVALEGITRVAAAADIDPDYATALAEVIHSGVEVLALPVQFDVEQSSLQLLANQEIAVVSAAVAPGTE